VVDAANDAIMIQHVVPPELLWCCQDGPDGSWTWRTPLAASRPYWDSWYSGLSDTFLALPVPKMLLLAGTDRCKRQERDFRQQISLHSPRERFL